MALITTPAFLDQGTEVTINTTNRTFTLNSGSGNLDDDGVTLQALYSFFKEEWKDDNNLISFPFPMIAITPEQFEFVDDWEPANDTTRKLIRTGGWAEVSAGGQVKREYLGVITLGNIDAGDIAYYAFATDTQKTDFTFNGPVNEVIQIFGDASNGNFDHRNEVLTLFIRVQGKTYDQTTTTDIGLSSITYKVERFPLSESIDLNIEATDTEIENDLPYTNMSIEYFDVPQSFTMGSTAYDFGIVIDGADGTSSQIYEFVQHALRQNADINAGSDNINGLLADAKVIFIGSRLDTLSATNPVGGGNGVYIDNLSNVSVNDVRYIDNTATYRAFPFVASGIINFSSTLQTDPDAIYRMFFTSVPSGDFGTANAVTVEDGGGSPIAGNVGGQSSISFSFDYDGNVQGGRTASTNAPITVVAIGLNNAQYVLAEATIDRSSSNIVSLVSALERNFTT